MMLRQIGFRRILPGLVAPNLEQRFFGAGQQGGVYLFDKAHQASAFQGGAYDTPLSAVEQFIGSFYDLSGNANHCSQTTSTARGKWSVRVNLLTQSDSMGTFSAASATFTAAPLVQSPKNTADVKLLEADASANQHTAQFPNPVKAGVKYRYYQYFKKRDECGLMLRLGGGFPAPTLITFDVTSGSITAQINAVGGSISLQDGWYLAWIEATALSDGTPYLQPSVVKPGGAAGYDGLGGKGVYLWGADFRLASNSHLPYQWVNTSNDYDTAGFPPYLLPDGADDYYTSASGGGSTTGLFICAAIAPMAAGAKQVIWSDASGNTGYELCINASNQVEFSAGTGSARVSCVSAALSFGAPKVITAQHDGTTLTVRVDGVATTAACGAASAGTAGTTLLRANGAASNYAKVQINGLVQRHGAQPSAELLTFTERYMANLQGRTL